jgi:hypothetical protein
MEVEKDVNMLIVQKVHEVVIVFVLRMVVENDVNMNNVQKVQ